MNQMLLFMDTGWKDGVKLILNEPMAVLPLWFVFLATVLIILLSVEVGFRVGVARRKWLEDTVKAEPHGQSVAAVLGLLAFMLGFTFHQAANRYAERRSLVIEEANAINTTYLRAGMLPEPQRTEIRESLREYVNIRLAALRSNQLNQILQGIAESEKLHSRLWKEAEVVAGKNPNSVATGLFIYSLNQVIDLHEKRVALGLKSHIPTSIWGTLYLISIFSMGMLGYHGGLSATRRFSTIIPLTLAFSIVILLINGLDQPLAGLVKISQEPLAELQKNWSTENTESTNPAR